MAAKSDNSTSNPNPAEILLSPQKCLSRVRYKAEIGRTAGNKRPAGYVGDDSGERRFNRLSQTRTTSP